MTDLLVVAAICVAVGGALHLLLATIRDLGRRDRSPFWRAGTDDPGD